MRPVFLNLVAEAIVVPRPGAPVGGPSPSSAPPAATPDVPPTLETLALRRYLDYLEAECAAYVALTQTHGRLLKGEYSSRGEAFLRGQWRHVTRVIHFQVCPRTSSRRSSRSCPLACPGWPARS